MESCGAMVAGDDFCTGSRMFPDLDITDEKNMIGKLTKALLSKPPCARTFDAKHPLNIAENILNQARSANARGVIGHTVKFCDPYLERLPVIRDTFKSAGMPLLMLEGDCSLRSIGQQKTRIEAFIEMLK
jgi:benzoyl-CoA reductase/2-hydroxyglutaryl-CoA dehydratase subunit BcrC/BadD/HgdB